MKNELNTKRIQNTGGGIAAVNAALGDGFEYAYNPTQSGGGTYRYRCQKFRYRACGIPL